MYIKESNKKRAARIEEIMKRLDAHYGDHPAIFLKTGVEGSDASAPRDASLENAGGSQPGADTAQAAENLRNEEAWRLLFATILSAQCTDARVNMVTKDLYRKYRTLEDFASCELAELEQDIRSTGFYHNKAKNIKACAQTLLSRHGGIVPDTIEALTALPGVGRKTGNLILGNIYGKDSIVVDTHVKRISNRLGLAASDDPVKVEYQLMEVLPAAYWIRWNTHIIALGRSLCMSQRPNCAACYLRDLCPSRDQASDYWKQCLKEQRKL